MTASRTYHAKLELKPVIYHTEINYGNNYKHFASVTGVFLTIWLTGQLLVKNNVYTTL